MPPRLPRYEILAELGQGGMSVVYRARDGQLPREVAVKVLHEFMARDPDARQRFHREAVAVAKLHHPGIVEIFDYSGPEAADAFIVTELIDGCTLRELVDRVGPPPLPELGALIIAALCEPLAHAHEAGVVHRDLKPENVMVTKSGELKLMDFGIAQIADGPRVTVTGTLLGSPAHMAPEVIDGARPDVRSDLFSMGTILYWLATGALPFEAGNPSALFRRILEGDYADPQQVQPRMGNGLARVIRRVLERDPAARYADARALGQALVAELEVVGLVPVETCARALLRDPQGFAETTRAPLLERLTSAGKAALAEGNVARAMDRLSRVLAIAPEHTEARALVQRLGQREAWARRARRTSAAAMLIAVVGGATWGALSWAQRAEIDRAEGERAAIERAESERAAAVRLARAQADELLAREAKDATARAPDEATGGPRATALGSAGPMARGPAQAEGDVPAPTPVSSTGTRLAQRASGGSRGSGSSPGPTPATARPPVPTPAVAAPPPSLTASEPPVPTPSPIVTGELRVRVGNSFANVYVDGKLAHGNVFTEKLRLSVGRHTVEVRKPGIGGFRPRLVEVDAEGRITEVHGDTRRPVAGELMFAIPRQGQAEVPPDWVPETGTASSL